MPAGRVGPKRSQIEVSVMDDVIVINCFNNTDFWLHLWPNTMTANGRVGSFNGASKKSQFVVSGCSRGMGYRIDDLNNPEFWLEI